MLSVEVAPAALVEDVAAESVEVVVAEAVGAEAVLALSVAVAEAVPEVIAGTLVCVPEDVSVGTATDDVSWMTLLVVRVSDWKMMVQVFSIRITGSPFAPLMGVKVIWQTSVRSPRSLLKRYEVRRVQTCTPKDGELVVTTHVFLLSVVCKV